MQQMLQVSDDLPCCTQLSYTYDRTLGKLCQITFDLQEFAEQFADHSIISVTYIRVSSFFAIDRDP